MKFINQQKYKDNYGIYGIVNKVNGKIYVGQTGERFQRRYWHHRWKLRDNSHDNSHLQRAFNKYGENNFEYIVLEIVTDINLLDDLEIKYINQYKQKGKNYNMLSGGGGRRGLSMSEHAKRIIGDKNRQHMLGTKHTEETKQKMSEIRKGRHINRSTDILDTDTVSQIKTLLISGKTASQVSKELNVKYKLINNLISNNTWSTVVVDGWEEYQKSRKPYKRLTKQDHKEIYRLHFNEGYSELYLAEMYNRTVNMIKFILKDDSNKLYDNPVPSLDQRKVKRLSHRR
ncbi:GIY-YIG nuclease family protein [Kineothrix sedimenti]|uniref:GIY-YIG nuclease family protein n=1 Tax=Kineothrix sedimenti TaxID=3123317 RepID=A0ABZ3F001_9FIRM